MYCTLEIVLLGYIFNVIFVFVQAFYSIRIGAYTHKHTHIYVFSLIKKKTIIRHG
jgi:hypothetical protein